MENLNRYTVLSGKLLLNVKMNKNTEDEVLQLSNLDFEQLKLELSSDKAKKTFWINIYNAYFQIFANRSIVRKKIFSLSEVIIANNRFSLDDIEHGILRKNRWKWSFGYFGNPFSSRLIHDLAVEDLDYRIHFALNCGAKSCPPIAFYKVDALHSQLNEAMHSFIISETTVNEKEQILKTSKLLHWYRGDFGGIKGIQKLLNHILELENNNYKIQFNDYSWEPYLENFG
ncbi:DUF547 domain-containing protein [Flavobacterium algicola]|uniref:DUF547 domain-containing protein n=1 Tax=Flavobacterium algicola TaxID=556529 RepID=UPI001EFD3810|nr:DUF547 domain-containing protein [Flavobacterium algicola]MCG9792686.1 DUF547 domain-containing protein [Flavobacterium algicola]